MCASRVHHRLDVFSSYGAEHDLKEDGVGQLRELVLSLQEELAAVRKEGRADRTALLAQLDAARSERTAILAQLGALTDHLMGRGGAQEAHSPPPSSIQTGASHVHEVLSVRRESNASEDAPPRRTCSAPEREAAAQRVQARQRGLSQRRREREAAAQRIQARQRGLSQRRGQLSEATDSAGETASQAAELLSLIHI